MKKAFFGALAAAFLSLATLLLGEGIYSVARWDGASNSVTYNAWRLISPDPDEHLQVEDGPEVTSVSTREGPQYTWLVGKEELDRLVPKFQAAHVALGNSPYNELRTDDAAVNAYVDGCRTQKPHLRKAMLQLRSNAFNPYDPLNMFFDADTDLDPEIQDIIAAYGFRRILHSTNEHGERVTLPAVESERKVVVAGASQANGSMVNDSETIASQMQALDRSRQYVNLGIGGAKAVDTFCALEKAADRYRGQIEELVYIYSESNFRGNRDYQEPAELLGWLKKFAEREGVRKVTIVFSPKIYNVVPQITRFRGYTGARAGTFPRERAEVAEQAAVAGFRYISIADIAMAEVNEKGTQFAALAIFVDQGHLSPYGTARLVERLMHD